MKKILAVTGIRSEYDIIYPVLKELNSHQNFDLKVVVTGAHLSDWHGFSVEKIEKDGFEIVEKIDYLLMTNRKTQRSKGVGLLVSGLTQTVERENPDLLIFVGDREESIATSIVGSYMDVLVVHIGGGDTVYGNVDDPVRSACSKLAHIHFALAQQYADNIVNNLSEEKFRVCFSGNPAMSNILNTKVIEKKDISKFLKMNINNSDYVVVLKHPLSSEMNDAYSQMKTTMQAIKEFSSEQNIKVIGIYPNTDPGSYDIINVIDEIKDENIQFYKALPRDIFVNIMRNAKCLIGNSSMGIVEAPMYKLPVVNVGNRQKGRLNAGNVEFVGYDVENIKKALYKACYNIEYIKYVKNLENPYGDGFAHKKIVAFLDDIDLNDKKWYIKKNLC